MKTLITADVFLVVLFLWKTSVDHFADALEYGNHVDDFIRQFTFSFSKYALSYRNRNLDSEYFDVLQQHFSKVPEPDDLAGEKPHHLGYGFPLRPPPPKPHPDDNGPPPDPHLQTSFVGALDLIAKNDDLRCVPRLLCEVFSGSNFKGSTKSDKDESLVPFLSKDGLIALLTVLNFVDDSPILLFARAAFLGLSSKGDAKVCLNAYPLCPKDPDQLVNYLNNHNGGFFQFFNHQPHHPPHNPHDYLDDTNDDGNFKYPNKYGFASRILNNAADHDDTSYYGKITNQPVSNEDNSRLPISSENYGQFYGASENAHYNPLYPSRNGRKFAFPGQVSESQSFSTNVMIFPDRTGTGNLVLSGDPSGELKISYTADSSARDNSKVKFDN